MRAQFLLAACLLVLPILPAGGATEESYQIKELIRDAPEWWTPEVRAQADIAGMQGKLLNPLTGEMFTPEEAAAIVQIPIGAPDYLFIRPGALFMGQNGGLCTYNFVYDAKTKIGTAGHCGSVGSRAYILSTPAPTVPLVTPLGTITSGQNAGVGKDWALVSIMPQWQQWVDPNMAYLGGPSCSAWTGTGGVIKHVGHGIQTGVAAAVPRVGYAGGVSNGGFTGYTEVSGGDSGSAIIQAFPGIPSGSSCAMGVAAGVLTHCASITGLECLPIFWATDIRVVPATVTTGFDPL